MGRPCRLCSLWPERTTRPKQTIRANPTPADPHTRPGLIPCKLVAGFQATSIFVSTISITAIALDRYKVIVYPTHQETASGTRGALLLLASVWIGALSLSLPLFTYRTIDHHEITSRKLRLFIQPARSGSRRFESRSSRVELKTDPHTPPSTPLTQSRLRRHPPSSHHHNDKHLGQ
jgi:hypothetical protein